MKIELFKELPILGILRGMEPEVLPKLVETVVEAGLTHIEVTMNTEGAAEQIKKIKELSDGKLCVGAGTVISMDSLKKALYAGAGFIVMPSYIPEIVNYCEKNQIPVFPGAFTPTEIFNCHQAGAAMVKVFPVKFFGPAYIKSILGPFDKINLLACGGINSGNIAEYFEAGAAAVAFGAEVFKKEWIDKGDFTSVGNYLKEIIQNYLLWKNGKVK